LKRKAKIMQLYLIRHPKTIVKDGICYGRTDLAVDAAEVERVATSLLERLPDNVAIWTSPLQRCRLLAERIAKARGTTFHEDARLMEMDFGAWEMQSWDAVPREEIDAWTKDVVYYSPGGGESVFQAAVRVKQFADEHMHRASPAAVICHAGTIRLLLACAEFNDPEEIALAAATRTHRIGHGEIVQGKCLTDINK
jgi:alpha-ribazole phosphatase